MRLPEFEGGVRELVGLEWMRAQSAKVPSDIQEAICAARRKTYTGERMYVERKWDGNWLRILKAPDGEVFACTKHAPAWNRSLERVLRAVLRGLPPMTRLDAEFVAETENETESGWEASKRMLFGSLSGPWKVYIFDCPVAGGKDLRGLPLRMRKRALGELSRDCAPSRRVQWMTLESAWVHEVDVRRLCDANEDSEWDALARFVQRHLTESSLSEGFVLKRSESVYKASMRRSPDWVKYKPEHSGRFRFVARVVMREVPKRGGERWFGDAGGEGAKLLCRNLPARAEGRAVSSGVERRVLLPSASRRGWERVGWIEDDATFDQRVMARLDAALEANDGVAYVVVLCEVRPNADGTLRFIRPRKVLEGLADSASNREWMRTRAELVARLSDRMLRTKATMGVEDEDDGASGEVERGWMK